MCVIAYAAKFPSPLGDYFLTGIWNGSIQLQEA